MTTFDFHDLRRIPRQVLERLEVCPAGEHGRVHVWCIWSPDDDARVAEVRAALRPYLPDAELELVQALPAPGFDPKAWLAALIDHVYAAAEPARSGARCSVCNAEDGRRVVDGGTRAICAACSAVAAAVSAEAGTCSFCGRASPVHAMAPLSLCDDCLALASAIFTTR